MNEEKRLKILVWILIISIIGIIVYFIWKHYKQNPLVIDIATGKDIGNGYIPATDNVDTKRTFKFGDRGNSVTEFQRLLNSKVSSKNPSVLPVQVDGIYGSETDTRLKNFTNGYLSSAKGNNSIDNLKNF